MLVLPHRNGECTWAKMTDEIPDWLAWTSRGAAAAWPAAAPAASDTTDATRGSRRSSASAALLNSAR